MLSLPLFRTLLFGLVICIGCPAWGWPPSEEDKTRWKNLIQQGKTDELRQLIEALRIKGEDIVQWVNFNLGFHSGGSFLIQVAKHGHIPIAQLLIDNGAEVNAKGHGYTAVHMAVQNNHPEMLDFLLGQGAQVDGENKITVTPLTQAAGKGHVGMVTSLLLHGASVQPRRSNGPLSEAARTGNTEIIRILLERDAMIDGDISMGGGRPLERAAGAGHLEAVKQLLAAGAKINLQNYLQETALHSAAEHGHESVVRYLLEQGANIEGEDPEAAPLTEKEQMERGRVRETLWQDDDEEDRRFMFGSPMNRAAGNGHISIVALLLKHGADVRNVHGNARAALQQVYDPDTGVEANFHQYIVKGKSIDVPTETFSTMPFSDWLTVQLDKMDTADLNNQAPGLINPAVLLITFNLPDSVNFRYKNGERIVRIESYVVSTDLTEKADHQKKSKKKYLRIMFTDEKGRRTPYVISEGGANEWLTIMRDRAALLGVKVDEVFNDHDSPMRSNDDSNEKKFMIWHRKILARLMMAALEDDQALKEWATRERRIKGVQLYCLGCGYGEDMIEFQSTLQKAGIGSKVFGVEKDEQKGNKALVNSLVALAFNMEPSVKSLPIVLLHRVQDSIPEWCELKTEFNDPIIVVAEEFFSRAVLKGAYEALHILQQLIQPDTADLVIIGGIYPPLVSERIASSIGWSVQQTDIYHSKEVSKCNALPDTGSTQKDCSSAFVLKRLSKEQQMESIYQRSLRRSVGLLSEYPPPFRTLDLSMFGLTLDALEYFLSHKENLKITQIDLSYSYIDEKQLPAVVNLLMGFPAAKFVMASGFEPWYPALVKAIEGQQRLKLVQRKDNKYRYELPSLDPDTAKLFGHYKTIPNQRVYEPPKIQTPDPTTLRTPQEEQETGYLSPHLVSPYHQQMLQVLSTHNLQLHTTPADNLCFFHAVTMQLGMTTPDLQAVLINQLQFNQASVEAEFPAFAGEQFQILVSELQQGQWGNAGLARLLAWIFNKRVIILYFNSSSGQVSVQIYNPDGSGSETISTSDNSGLPEDLNEQDIILVHNGLGHWLAAFDAEAEINLAQHNSAVLNPDGSMVQSLLQQAGQLYKPSIIPQLLALLMVTWNAKFK